MPDQIAIFNEPEAEAVVFYSEPSVDEVILKPKRKKGHKAKIVNDTSVSVIIAPSPNPVIPKSLASPSLVTHIMTRKYMEALPLYRQEQQFKHDGLAISRQTMANWMIKASKDWLKPLYKEMHAELKKKEVLHADETMLEVLCEPDRPAKTNSYMWMYRTSGDSVPIILYDYREGLAYCNRLFEIERSLCDVSFEKRKEQRELQSRPILEAYFAWLEIQKEKALPQSYLGKAVTYSLNQKEKLYTFLEDGRIELSNNRGERSIKPFVISRHKKPPK